VTPGKRVPRGELWAGSPARRLRPISAEEQHYMTTLPAHYAAIAAEHQWAKV
jgi:carbonic anhydrase/acetyltransferase-like protein (isoleucine patch superfamily)